MPRVYDINAFSARVDFAARVISDGRRTTRAFDTCFEMWDGDAVAVAVYHRSRHNPKLRRNLWRYISRQITVAQAFENRRRPTRALAAWAAELRAEAAFTAKIEAERRAQSNDMHATA
jgi:hypothetical protein